MSRSSIKPNIGEPYQIYHEVKDAGKNIQGSKKRVRWLIGFTERDGEVEVALVHSVVSGKKTVYEDGREITSSTNYLATDFGHTWRSETCPGRLFRVEFTMSLTTDPTVYTFMVDGIKFSDMPKKGLIGGGGDYRRGSQAQGHDSAHRSVGFSNGTSSAARSSGTSAGFGKTAHSAPSSSRVDTGGFGQPSEPPSHKSRRFIYDDEDEDETPAASAAAAPAAGGPPRGNFQSPFAAGGGNSNNASGFGFDPFSETPAPAPPAKSAAANLFNAFDDSPAQGAAKKTSDPFASSGDPFAAPTRKPSVGAMKGTPAQAPKPPAGATPAAAAPNFFDDDFGAAQPAAASAGDFAAFPPAAGATPARRSSAVEISQDFAGLSFTSPSPPKPSPAAQLFAATEPERQPSPAPAEPAGPSSPWSAGANLVNLDLSGTTAPKRPSITDKGPSLSSMMHTSTTTNTGLVGTNTGLNRAMGGSPAMGAPAMGGVPSNTRASFTTGSPLDLFGASPAPVMGGPAPMGGFGGSPAPMPGAMNAKRPSFTGATGPAPMGGMGGMGGAPMGGMGGMGGAPMGGMGGMGGASMGGMGGAPMGGMGGMGGAPMGGMGGMGAAPMGGMGGMGAAPMGGMGGPRASFTAGPGGAMPMGGMPPAGGNMGQMGAMGNTRGSFISTQPPAGMPGGMAAFGTPQQPPKSSLDTLNWDM